MFASFNNAPVYVDINILGINGYVGNVNRTALLTFVDVAKILISLDFPKQRPLATSPEASGDRQAT